MPASSPRALYAAALRRAYQISILTEAEAIAVAHELELNDDVLDDEELQDDNSSDSSRSSSDYRGHWWYPYTDRYGQRYVIASLEDLGLSADTAFKLLANPRIDAAYSSTDILEGLFDASDRSEDGDLILWLNDIETDERYSSWKPSVFSMMQPGPYGMPIVRLNLVNVIFAVDLTQARMHYFLASTVTGLIARKFPLRFGLVPLIPDGGERFEEGVKLAKALTYFNETMDWPADTTFMKHLIANVRSEADLAAPISLAHARQVFDELNAHPPLKDGKEKHSWGDVTDITDELARTLVQKSQAYGKRLDLKVGLRASADEGEGEPFMDAFINGRHHDVDDARFYFSFIQSLQTDVGSFFSYFAQKVYAGELNDDIASKMNMAD
ncbi:hypothetical protein PENSPDRAFT_693925 [Peniophora sp. CONT]|nr:hypothetical protein PENSPDRAFT_693925 [Peniophora sp. CONT]